MRKRGNPSNRPQRVAEVVREILAVEVQGGLKDPDVGFVTVTGVEMSKDLRNAKVFVSVMGTEPERRKSMAALKRAAGYLRGECGRALQMAFAPELDFKLDGSLERGMSVDGLLKRVREEDAALARLRGEEPAPPVPPAAAANAAPPRLPPKVQE